MKTLIDEVSILAIESCLIQKLPGLFSADEVCDLSEQDLHLIAGESERSAGERVNAMRKLHVLEMGMSELKRLNKHDFSVLEYHVCASVDCSSG